jgi:hypothetical protein
MAAIDPGVRSQLHFSLLAGNDHGPCRGGAGTDGTAEERVPPECCFFTTSGELSSIDSAMLNSYSSRQNPLWSRSNPASREAGRFVSGMLLLVIRNDLPFSRRLLIARAS